MFNKDSKKKYKNIYFHDILIFVILEFMSRETIHIHLEIIFLQYNFLLRWNHKILQKM